MKKCEEIGDVMHTGTIGLGCEAFKEAQRHACLCEGRKITKQEMQMMDEKEL